MTGFIVLNDKASTREHILRGEHISAVEIRKQDREVTVHLIGGQTLALNTEESKELLHHFHKTHPHTHGQ